jgi:four helix bundle protein
MALQTFEDLDVWKRSCRLAVDLCVELEDFKPWSLKDQMERASVSVPSNIAEGAERDSDGDFRRFLRIAKGSSGELRTQLYIAQAIAKKKGKSPIANTDHYLEETRGISAMLQALIKSINTRTE